MKATLLVLAAGMGSRYGGLKQMDAFGPSGETIIDYSIYDAINAGFTKVVFVIRESFKEAFKEAFTTKFRDKIEVAFVCQELDRLPAGISCPVDRQKPWGTGHAVYVAKDHIDGPFAVINADDYYGQNAYKVLIDFFEANEGSDNTDYAVVAYYLSNTLSEHGTVNRGICYSDGNGNLDKVVEREKIQRDTEGVIIFPHDDHSYKLAEDTLVSMNMWAFYPSYFEYCEDALYKFIKARGEEEKSEFYIPALIDELIQNKLLNVNILDTTSKWFGVTYQEDRPIVIDKLNKLIEEGIYPKDLWA
jgi:UTP-glucose-1-phosphate uridylyltransferase